MELKKLLEESIDSFWDEKFPHIDRENISLEEFEDISKSVIISPFSEIEFISKNSKEFIEFEKSININNEESYYKLLKFMDSINEFTEEIVFGLSQFIYYEFHFVPKHFQQGRFPSFRTLSDDNIRKVILLNDSLINGFKLKKEDKLTIHEIFTIGYSLGEWGKIDTAKIIFELINKTLNLNDEIYTPIINVSTTGDPRWNLGLVHPMGKIYQLKGQYQKSIDTYIDGVNPGIWTNWIDSGSFPAYYRHIEDLTEAYKSSELLKDNDQCEKIYKLIKKYFINLFSRDFTVGEKHIEIAREPSLIAMMIRYKIFKNIK